MNRVPFCRHGSILLTTVFAMTLVFASIALVTDVGWWYYNRARLQTAVNAGWKAGFDYMKELQGSSNKPLVSGEFEKVVSRVREIAVLNGYTTEQAAAIEVKQTAEGNLEVFSRQPVGVFFLRMIDDRITANVAAFRGGGGGEDPALIPLAIPHGVTQEFRYNRYNTDLFNAGEKFQPGRSYILKLGHDEEVFGGDIMPFGVVPLGAGKDFGYVPGVQYEVRQSPGGGGPLSPGNFGSLNLNPNFGQGGGANNYRDNIMNGYQHKINVGEKYFPQTGNIAGPTVEAVNYRINNGLVDVRIPVVSGYGAGSSQACEIIGFLNFKLIRTGIGGRGASAKASVIMEYVGMEPPDLAGKPKEKYGPIDPDNVLGGNLNDYRDRLMFGYNSPLGVNDRILAEAGNKATETDEAITYRLASGSVATGRRVIVAITDVGSEISDNNPENSGAETIYDLKGLDNPNGEYSKDKFSFGSSVRIIGFAEFEILEPPYEDDSGSQFHDGYDSLGEYYPGQVRGKFIRYVIDPEEAAGSLN